MAIKMVAKQKPVSIPAEPVQSIAASESKVKVKGQTESLVDELIDLNSRLTESGAFEMMKRVDELKKSLQAVIQDIGADTDTPYTFHTTEGEVTFSACTNSIEIVDREAMIKKLGMETFKAVAKVGVTDLKKYLSPAEIEAFSKPVKGSRSLKVVKRAT